MENQYDVFLSYNSKDRSSVEQLATKLKAHAISVWLDEEQITPGDSVLRNIDEGLRSSKAIAVFVGPNSLGPWQTPEVEAAITVKIKAKTRAIPVLLPGATETEIQKLPLFLQNLGYADFREGLDSEAGLVRLRWGITGKKPDREIHKAPSKVVALIPEEDVVEEAIEDLVQILKTQNITFFLGPGAVYGSQPMPAQASEIARELLQELGIIEASYKELLPPVDVASLYFGVRSGDPRLEEKVRNQVAEKSRVFPQTYDLLAGLIKLLSERPDRRSGGRNLQLIVTTNLDLMAERALLRAGLSFTRVVQLRMTSASKKRIDVKEFRNVQLIGNEIVQMPDEDGNPQQARLNDFVELDRLITGCGRSLVTESSEDKQSSAGIKFGTLTEPILYKYLGSGDIPDSCVISTLHHFDFVRDLLHKGIPDEITSTICNSTILFLGLWFMDPDFRLTYYTLLRDRLRENDRRYALQLPPQRFGEDVYHRMERGIWERIKQAGVRQIGITPLEEPCDTFLNKLHFKLQEELRLQL